MTDPSLHLVAYVINVTTEPEVRLDVATCDEGEWFTNDGHQVWPYWTLAFDTLSVGVYANGVAHLAPLRVPSFTPEWLDHLVHEADAMAARATFHKSSGLLESLGLVTTQPTTPKAPTRR